MARDDADAAFGEGRPAHEVELAALGGVLVVVQELGVDLPGQVHLQRGVDREDVSIHADDVGVVDVLGRVTLHARVVVQRVIERLRACR
jgi:hypothetical protein